MINLGPHLQVGNFASREVTGETLLRLQKTYLAKPIWIDLNATEVRLLANFLDNYLQGVDAGGTEAFVTEVKLGH